MKELGIALIGAGEIAQNFHLPVFFNNQSAKVVAIFDQNKTKADLIAAKYDIPFVCKSIDELLNIDFIDAVDICTSTDSHCEIALQCIEASKSVFIEKPAARNLKEIELISEAAKKFNVKVMAGMNQRFRTDAIMLKNFIQFGDIGSVYYTKAGWIQGRRQQSWWYEPEKSGGGVLMDLGIPIIDSLLWFNDFRRVHSVRCAAYSKESSTVEDICSGMLIYDDDSQASFEVIWNTYGVKNNFYCNIYGNKGYAQINPVKMYQSNGNIFSPSNQSTLYNNYKILMKSFENELKHFLNAVTGFVPVISTINEAATVMKVIEAIYKSSREKREVVVE